jgi:adenosylcobinamide kinase/adenosylcobinamide-phosphate guanylyltransferase
VVRVAALGAALKGLAMLRELILGGQKSGKSRCAEARAAAWLQTPGHAAVLIATALAGDVEMAARIARHRAERSARVPALACVEEPHDLAAALAQWSAPQRMVLVDCLTLWWTQLALPLQGLPASAAQLDAAAARLVGVLAQTQGPIVLVSNEIGLGVAPLSAAARDFVDSLGSLHQRVAAVCERVTLMVAGHELAVKGLR